MTLKCQRTQTGRETKYSSQGEFNVKEISWLLWFSDCLRKDIGLYLRKLENGELTAAPERNAAQNVFGGNYG